MTSRPHRPPLVALERCSILLGGRPVLDDISFSLRAGEHWAVVGANGAGKTLLLKLIRGDLWPTPLGDESRTYDLDGNDPGREPAGAKERIAYVGPERQDKYLRRDWNLTVQQVVTTGLFDEDIPLTVPTRAQRERVRRLLARFGLWTLRRRRFLELSYGQRRLVLVARAYAGRPAILLLDEVFNGLDARVRMRLRRALEQSGGRGPAWVLTTHRAVDLPANVTHVAQLVAGRIVAAGPVGRVRLTGTARQGERLATPVMRRRRASAAGPLIRIQGATVYREYRLVLKDVDWTLAPGEHWAIVGRNGAGKSTFLSLLYGDLHPALGGVIERRGVPFGTPIVEWKRRVGFVSPELQAGYFRAASLEEIVVSGRHASIGLNVPPTPADLRAARRWLRFFGIDALRDRGPREVSYGQLRLALVARAMANDPELLLLDEPFTGLDADVHAAVARYIDALARAGTQVVMAVHHDADRIPAVRNILEILPGGRIRATQPPSGSHRTD